MNSRFFQVFPPSFRELKHPFLEFFDLDQEFSSEKSRLAQVKGIESLVENHFL